MNLKSMKSVALAATLSATMSLTLIAQGTAPPSGPPGGAPAVTGQAPQVPQIPEAPEGMRPDDPAAQPPADPAAGGAPGAGQGAEGNGQGSPAGQAPADGTAPSPMRPAQDGAGQGGNDGGAPSAQNQGQAPAADDTVVAPAPNLSLPRDPQPVLPHICGQHCWRWIEPEARVIRKKIVIPEAKELVPAPSEVRYVRDSWGYVVPVNFAPAWRWVTVPSRTATEESYQIVTPGRWVPGCAPAPSASTAN